MRQVLFVFFLYVIGFVYPVQVFAQQTYFEFLPLNKITDLEGKIIVSLEYELSNLKENQFKVRPVSENGTAQIWAENSQRWVSEKTFWSQLPNLSRKMQIRFLTNDFSSLNLHFQIQDTQTAKIYQTPKHKVWGRRLVEEYISKLNENILRVVE